MPIWIDKHSIHEECLEHLEKVQRLDLLTYVEYILLESGPGSLVRMAAPDVRLVIKAAQALKDADPVGRQTA